MCTTNQRFRLAGSTPARRLGALVGPSTCERAQSTVEYALVLLGAAAIALLLVSWATGSDVIGRLFEAVFSRILSQA